MKKKIFVTILIVIALAIVSGYFYTTFSPHSNEHRSLINTSVNEENSVSNVTTDSINNNVAESEGLFSSYYDEAEEMLSKMTLEEKVGQMFLARYPSSGVINEIKNYQPAGYILFGKDFQNATPNSIKKNYRIVKMLVKYHSL